MKINYQFYDSAFAPTSDRIAGAPMVPIQLSVNGAVVIGGSAGATALGLIDTGANATYIDDRLLTSIGVASDRMERNHTGNGPHDIHVNDNAVLQIIGLSLAVPVILYRLPNFGRAAVLIGRDVLDCFSLVYDPRGNSFTLEEP